MSKSKPQKKIEQVEQASSLLANLFAELLLDDKLSKTNRNNNDDKQQK